MYAMKECWKCNGVGWDHIGPCPNCGGKGEVKTPQEVENEYAKREYWTARERS